MSVRTSPFSMPSKAKDPSPPPPQGPLWELWGIGILGGLACGLWSIHYGYPKVPESIAQKMLLWHSLSAGLFLLFFGHLRIHMAQRGPAAWGGEASYVVAILLSGFLGLCGWVGLGLPGLGLWGLGGLLSGAIFLWLGPELVFWRDASRHAAVGLAGLFGLVPLVFLWLWLEPWLIDASPWLCVLAAAALFTLWPSPEEGERRSLLVPVLLLAIALGPWQLGFLRTTNLIVHARQMTQGGWTLPHQDQFVMQQLAALESPPLEAIEDLTQQLLQKGIHAPEAVQIFINAWKKQPLSQHSLRAAAMGKELAHLAASERRHLAQAFVKDKLHNTLLNDFLEGLYPHSPDEGREALAAFLLDISKLDHTFAQRLKRRLRLATIFHRTFRPLGARMLQKLGTQAPHALEQVTLLAATLLRSADPNERYLVLVALRGQSPANLYTLRELLRAPLYKLVMKDNTPSRTTALSILYKITLYSAHRSAGKALAPWSAFSHREVQQMIYDANAVVREYALRLLNLLNPSVSQKMKHFRTLLKEDLDASVRMTVLNEAAKIKSGTPQIIGLFLEALRDPDASIRYIALYNLGQRAPSTKPIQDALRRLLKDPDPDTRTLAHKLLKQP
ncbi:MAG: hypothetical protein H6728_02750 [Myxococcales bacterium]|nr:hypothetical protein [Myxococcales bacterium]